MSDAPSKFVQITTSACGTAGAAVVHALDEYGRVWRYYPADARKSGPAGFAYWTRLTDHRSESTR